MDADEDLGDVAIQHVRPVQRRVAVGHGRRRNGRDGRQRR